VPQGRLELLRDALTALASDAQEQVCYLNSQEVPVSVDELALDLDAIAAAAADMLDNREIDAEQFECVRALHQKLGEMSGAANTHLWAEDALFRSPEWEEIRDSAKRCLSLLAVRNSKYRPAQ
jgi:hypothetical protein